MWGWIVLAGLVGYGVFLWAGWVLARAAATSEKEEEKWG